MVRSYSDLLLDIVNINASTYIGLKKMKKDEKVGGKKRYGIFIIKVNARILIHPISTYNCFGGIIQKYPIFFILHLSLMSIFSELSCCSFVPYVVR